MPLAVRMTLMSELRRRGVIAEGDADWRSTVSFASALKETYAKAVRREGSWGLLLGYTKKPKLQAVLAFQKIGGRMKEEKAKEKDPYELPKKAEDPSPSQSGAPSPAQAMPPSEAPAPAPAPAADIVDRDEIWRKLQLCVKGCLADETLLLALLSRSREQQVVVVDERRIALREKHDAIDINLLPTLRLGFGSSPLHSRGFSADESGKRKAAGKVTPREATKNRKRAPAEAPTVQVASTNATPSKIEFAPAPSALSSGLRRTRSSKVAPHTGEPVPAPAASTKVDNTLRSGLRRSRRVAPAAASEE